MIAVAIISSHHCFAVALIDDDFQLGTRNPSALRWWMSSPFATGTSWEIAVDPAFQTAANPYGYVLSNHHGNSVDTTMYAGFPGVTLGVDETLLLQMSIRRTALSGTATLVMRLGNSGSTHLIQDYTGGASPIGDDKNLSVSLPISMLMEDTGVYQVTYLIKRLTDGTYKRQVRWEGDLIVNDTLSASTNPTYLFDQAAFYCNRPSGQANRIGEITVAKIGAETFWTTVDKLIPAWGLYPIREVYNGRFPTGDVTAWGTGKLTWVADFPATATYGVFVRRYNMGTRSITIDEGSAISGGSGYLDSLPGLGTYVWEHVGNANITSGQHHVDIAIGGGIFDAIAFSADPNFNPVDNLLPEVVLNPVVRAPRTYRSDAHLGSSGVVLATAAPYGEALNDHVPATNEILSTLNLWGAADQYVNGTFSIRALSGMSDLSVSISSLTKSGTPSATIPTSEIDIRVVHLRRRLLTLFQETYNKVIGDTLLPDLLLRDDRGQTIPPTGAQGGYGGATCHTSIAAHQSRQIWLTVRVPSGSPAGTYTGTVTLSGPVSKTLPVSLEVKNVGLEEPTGYYSIYYPAQSIIPSSSTYVSPSRYLAELEDQKRHGVNAATIYGVTTTQDLKDGLDFLVDADLTDRAPTVMIKPPYQAGSSGIISAQNQVDEALSRGFPDLYYTGIDEPHGTAEINAMLAQCQWTLTNGFHTFSAINSVATQDALKDVLDRPVYSLTVFHGPDNAAVAYARDKNFKPISYWQSSISYPLYFRGVVGLYSTRCGYMGSTAWSYQDYPQDAYTTSFQAAVAYPDANGDPIPTLAWEAFRAGIDDVRYLEALQRALNAAQAVNPKSPELTDAINNGDSVIADYYTNISGAHWKYIRDLTPERLDESRQAFADATVQLRTALGL